MNHTGASPITTPTHQPTRLQDAQRQGHRRAHSASVAVSPQPLRVQTQDSYAVNLAPRRPMPQSCASIELPVLPGDSPISSPATSAASAFGSRVMASSATSCSPGAADRKSASAKHSEPQIIAAVERTDTRRAQLHRRQTADAIPRSATAKREEAREQIRREKVYTDFVRRVKIDQLQDKALVGLIESRLYSRIHVRDLTQTVLVEDLKAFLKNRPEPEAKKLHHELTAEKAQSPKAKHPPRHSHSIDTSDDDIIVSTQSSSDDDSGDQTYDSAQESRIHAELLFDSLYELRLPGWRKNHPHEPDPEFIPIRDSDADDFARNGVPGKFIEFNRNLLASGAGGEALKDIVHWITNSGSGSKLYREVKSKDLQGGGNIHVPSGRFEKKFEKTLGVLLEPSCFPNQWKILLRQNDRRLVDLFWKTKEAYKNAPTQSANATPMRSQPPTYAGLRKARLALVRSMCGLSGYLSLLNQLSGPHRDKHPVELGLLSRLLSEGLKSDRANALFAQLLLESEQALPERQRHMAQSARLESGPRHRARSMSSTGYPASSTATTSTATSLNSMTEGERKYS